ncbi:MAG: hypothetical protein O7D86_12780 [Proteobacteria bacterium]|nr:hypothetical protein [Pseudomonadota bacterium]
MTVRKTIRFFAIFTLVTLVGCNMVNTREQIHHTVAEQRVVQPDEKILFLPIDISVHQISAGGLTEEVPEWTDMATNNVTKAILNSALAFIDLESYSIEQLDPDKKLSVEEHIALYDVVAGSAYLHTGLGSAENRWQHKSDHFDYTLGPGLSFLKEYTDADSVLMVIGADYETTAGRKLVWLAIAAIFGAGIPLGYSYLTAGLVDIETGNIKWLDYTVNQSTINLRDSKEAETLVIDLFKNFPGNESITAATSTSSY